MGLPNESPNFSKEDLEKWRAFLDQTLDAVAGMRKLLEKLSSEGEGRPAKSVPTERSIMGYFVIYTVRARLANELSPFPATTDGLYGRLLCTPSNSFETNKRLGETAVRQGLRSKEEPRWMPGDHFGVFAYRASIDDPTATVTGAGGWRLEMAAVSDINLAMIVARSMVHIFEVLADANKELDRDPKLVGRITFAIEL